MAPGRVRVDRRVDHGGELAVSLTWIKQGQDGRARLQRQNRRTGHGSCLLPEERDKNIIRLLVA